MRNELLRFAAITGLAINSACNSATETRPSKVTMMNLLKVPDNPHQIIVKFNKATAQDLETVFTVCGHVQSAAVDAVNVLVTTEKANCFEEVEKINYFLPTATPRPSTQYETPLLGPYPATATPTPHPLIPVNPEGISHGE